MRVRMAGKTTTTERTVEPTGVGEETEGVLQVVLYPLAAAAHSRYDDDAPLLREMRVMPKPEIQIQPTCPWNSSTLPTLTWSATGRSAFRIFTH